MFLPPMRDQSVGDSPFEEIAHAHGARLDAVERQHVGPLVDGHVEHGAFIRLPALSLGVACVGLCTFLGGSLRLSFSDYIWMAEGVFVSPPFPLAHRKGHRQVRMQTTQRKA